MVAPLWPHAVQRADCRSLSLDTLTPHRITGTAHATGGVTELPAWVIHVPINGRHRPPRYEAEVNVP